MVIGSRRVAMLLVGMMVFASCGAIAAERLRAPSEVFHDPVNLALEATVESCGRYVLRLRQLRLITDDSTIAELRLRRLTGGVDAGEQGPRDGIVVRRTGDSPLVVPRGARVIVAVTELVAGRYPQPELSRNPAGAQVVMLPAVGEALFPYSPHLAAVLGMDSAAARSDPAAFLAHLEPLLRDPDTPTRRCVAVELSADPQLVQHMTSRTLKQVRKRIADEREDPVVREFLLHAAVKSGDSRTAGWVVAAARGVLANAPLQIDLESAVPALQDAALHVVAAGGGVDDVAVVARLLRSSSPGVATSAAEGLDALDPAAARREVERALGEAGLPEQSVRNLKAFLRRQRTAPVNSDSEE